MKRYKENRDPTLLDLSLIILVSVLLGLTVGGHGLWLIITNLY